MNPEKDRNVEKESGDDVEKHLQEDILPRILVEPVGPEDIEFVDKDVERNREKLWEALKPSLDVLIDKFQLPRQKPEEMTDVEYFDLLTRKMCKQIMSVRRKNPELVKWSSWPAVANETKATNCSLSSQVFLKLLEDAGYEVEYGAPGPLSHSVVFAKSGEDYFYVDPTNGIVEKVAKITEVDGIKVYMLRSDGWRLPYEAVPVFPPEFSVASTISNLGALQSGINRPDHSWVVSTLAKEFNMAGKQYHYYEWVERNLFPERSKLTESEFWKEEAVRVERRINS
jgi:hypothetical protein